MFSRSDGLWWKLQGTRIILTCVIVGLVAAIAWTASPIPTQAVERRLSTSFVYDNPNDTYVPNQYVRYGHGFTNQDFEANMEYAKRLLYAPIITFVLGLLAFLGLLCGLISRICCECGRCLPDTKASNYEEQRWQLTVGFYVLVVLVLVFDQMVFVGNEDIDQGTMTIDDSILGVRDIFQVLDTDSITLLAYGDNLTAEYDAAKDSCSYATAADLSSYIETYEDSLSSFQSATESVVDGLNVIHEHNTQEGVLYRSIGLYSVWGLAVLSVLLFAGGQLTQSAAFSKFAVFFGLTTYLLFILLGIIWLFLTSALADVCMDPSYNLVKSVPSGDVQDLAYFYVSCVGNNTLQEDVDSGRGDLTTLNDTVTQLLGPGYCPGNSDLLAMRATLSSIDVTFDDVIANMECPPLRTLWFQFINDGLCDQMYTGLFFVWGSQLFTSFFLICLALTATVVYQYYSGRRVGSEDSDSDGDLEQNRIVDASAPTAVVIIENSYEKVL